MNKSLLTLPLAIATSIFLTACTVSAQPGSNASLAAPNSFAANVDVQAFAQEMQDKHGLDRELLLTRFSKLQPNQVVLKAIQPPSTPAQKSWQGYRARFLGEQRIKGGVQFWLANRETLQRASQTYGVPEEIIVAIIGVETEYGRNMGNFSVMQALATLAFYYPRRAEFFRSELEQFLLLARENDMEPLSIKGSFAGAIGIPQFMPGSQRRFAVDFDGDRKVDLRNNVVDAIGSVGRFLEQHGWKRGEPITVLTNATSDNPAIPALVQAGIQPVFARADLAKQGIVANEAPSFDGQVALLDLLSPESNAAEYWLGFNNFYVITRYNRSVSYAMSVYQLAEAIKARVSLR